MGHHWASHLQTNHQLAGLLSMLRQVGLESSAKDKEADVLMECNVHRDGYTHY